MMEKLEHFFNRIYVDFARDKVWVYPKTRGKGNFQIWTLEQAIQYFNYLKQNSVEV